MPSLSNHDCSNGFADSDDAICITGISGRFPESANIEEFKQNLFGNCDMVTADDRRWKPGLHGLPDRCGKLKNLEKFDAFFFSVHAKQAHVMDPQLRILLELTHETIIDAGFNPNELRKSRTGVFIGVSSNESEEFWNQNADEINGYGLTGCCRAMFPNRISYIFDFNGPSYAIDTACSSSMFALEQAFSAIRSGHCDSAIVGGVNLLLKPTSSLSFHRLSMLSADGKCKAFDAAGNGYVRAEAAATILLQKKKNARRIYAVVLNAKTNTDGYKVQGITYPSGAMQKQLIEEVYSEIRLNPNQVEYVEAHGTGTKVGDPQEVTSIADVFCKNRNGPLLIGSVKSNMGHSEPASGLCSIAKLVIAMQTRTIPGNLHFKTPNPDISALNDGRLKVVDQNTEWNLGIVAVNSFGFGGANAHIVLQPYKSKNHTNTAQIIPMAIASGRTEKAVTHFLSNLKKKQDAELFNLVNKIHSTNIVNHSYRGYLIDSTIKVDQLTLNETRPVWFVFSGMGTQWSHMARDLMSLPLFRNSIEKCSKILEPFKIDLIHVISESDEKEFDNVLNSFISIASIQIALTDVLRELKIEPDGIVGHSIGEIGCAYADRTFTTEQAILTAYSRGRAILDSKLPPGAMAAVGLSWEECLKRCPATIQPACHNSDDSVTVSGPPKDLEKFTNQLTSEGIFARMVKSSNVAFHSKYIKDAGPKLRKALEKIIPAPKKRSSRWISSSIAEAKWSEATAQYSSVDYHVNNLLSPVLFRDALKHIPENAIVIEIAPHCLLQAILKRSLADRNVTSLGLMKRDHTNNLEYFLSSIGNLFNYGLQPDINILYPSVRYPISHGTEMLSSLIEWDHSADWSVANFSGLHPQSSEMVVEIDLSKDSDRFLSGHQIDGRILFPATGYLTLVWKFFSKMNQKEFEDFPVTLSNVHFRRATILPKEGTVKFMINIFNVSGQFELYESGAVVVSGTISALLDDSSTDDCFLQLSKPDTSKAILNSTDIYKELRLRGYDYSNQFCGIKSSNLNCNYGSLKWDNNWISFMDTMLQFSILSQNTRELYLPTRLQKVLIDPKKHIQLYENNSEVNVQMAHDINTIQAGGIEFRGMKASLAPRRQQVQSDPKLEKYQLCPYFAPTKHSTPSFTEDDALTILLQILIENSQGALKLKVLEIMADPNNILLNKIVPILESEPMIYVNGFVLNSQNYKIDENDLKHFQLVEKFEENCHLVVINSEAEFENAKKCLKDEGFIMCTNPISKFDGFEVIAKHNKYCLLKKPISIDFEASHLVYVNEKKSCSYEWLEDVKKAMFSSQTDNSRIFLVSEGAKHETTGLIGMVNCLKQEYGGSKIRSYILHSKNENFKFSFENQMFRKQISFDLVVNVWQNENWASYRHLKIDRTQLTNFQVQHAYINTITRGDLSSLRWIESSLTYHTENSTSGYELCHVYYAPLNFRDIMLATGKLPPDALPGDLAGQDCILGLEFSGRSAKSGRRVMGMVAAKSLATTVLADSSFIWDVPEKWSLEEAATVPVVYGTSYYALIVRGRMQPGESVLIHAGSGGVGQAAIAIALHMKCTVFTTVGSEAKRQYLKTRFPLLRDDHIGNSRDCSFEQLVLGKTKGRGVDLVLNSLAEEKLQASIRCLAKDGRFLEIGKVDLSNNSSLGMAVFLKNITFHGILLDALFESHGQDKKDIVRLIRDGIENGAVRPLPSSVYPETQVEQAFRFMASGKHIGKVLIKVREEEANRSALQPQIKLITAIPKSYMNPEKCYILVGGLGGFGLELTNWLIKRGATKIILTSRSGIKTGYQHLCVKKWSQMNVKIEVSTFDCSYKDQVQKLLENASKIGPIGGIFNLAAVLRDAMMDKQTIDDFNAVCRPKTLATAYLDELSQKLCPQLDYFVVFSSVSCGRGNAGQSNYGYANSIMERICEKRQEQGFPAKAIQWGAIGDVGLIMDTMNGNNELVVGGTVPQRINSCLDTMDYFLQQPEAVVASMVLAEKTSKLKENKSDTASLLDAIANILGIKNVESVSVTSSLADLGMDSLMGSEIKQTLERNYDLLLNAQEIRNLTFAKLLEMTNTKNDDENKKNDFEKSSTELDKDFQKNGHFKGYLMNIDIFSYLLSTNNDLTSSSTSMKNGQKTIKFNVKEIQLPTESPILMTATNKYDRKIFIIHPIEGTVDALKEVVSHVQGFSVYGLQCTKDVPQKTINEMAAFYVKQIRSVQSNGPYKICGYSFGACVAFEIALQFQRDQQQVHLILLDGSHLFVTIHTKKSRKSKRDEVDFEQSEFLVYFINQFHDFGTHKILNEFLMLSNWDERLERATEYISKIHPIPKKSIKIAAESFYKKLFASYEYTPDAKFNGRACLLRANDSYVELNYDYDLNSVCQHPVEIIELEGNHKTILVGESAKKVAETLVSFH